LLIPKLDNSGKVIITILMKTIISIQKKEDNSIKVLCPYNPIFVSKIKGINLPLKKGDVMLGNTDRGRISAPGADIVSEW
jgi:hypothetical protein